jgi:hypothetical protein
LAEVDDLRRLPSPPIPEVSRSRFRHLPAQHVPRTHQLSKYGPSTKDLLNGSAGRYAPARRQAITERATHTSRTPHERKNHSSIFCIGTSNIPLADVPKSASR